MRNESRVIALLAAVGVAVTSSVGAHPGDTDAAGCHGTQTYGVQHCHVQSVPLSTQDSNTVHIGDARLSGREARLPDCLTCESVAEVQRILTRLGYRPGPVDGIIGPSTREAIRAYQRAEGLAADGIPSDDLRIRLRAEG